jgi:CheY-like chemotaxis protein
MTTRILLVEDNKADALLIQEALRQVTSGHVVDHVDDGERALAHLRGGGQRPDLVLLDLNLPRLDGREVLTAMKGDPDLRAIPVIVLSTSSSPGDVADCYARHANSYLVKPMHLEELGAVMRAIDCFWLRLARLPAEGAA